MNDGLGFSWDFDYVDDVQFDYYSLSPETENFPVDDDLLAEINYYDAMARQMSAAEEVTGDIAESEKE